MYYLDDELGHTSSKHKQKKQDHPVLQLKYNTIFILNGVHSVSVHFYSLRPSM